MSQCPQWAETCLCADKLALWRVTDNGTSGAGQAILFAPLVIPVILLIILAERLFGLQTSADLTARHVEGYLQDFLDGTGGDRDWDDFISVKITDPSLAAIRRRQSGWACHLQMTDVRR